MDISILTQLYLYCNLNKANEWSDIEHITRKDLKEDFDAKFEQQKSRKDIVMMRLAFLFGQLDFCCIVTGVHVAGSLVSCFSSDS